MQEQRKYQSDIYDVAITKNTIAFLPTGSGKTLIACNIIKERLKRIQSDPTRKKLIAFITPTKLLLSQQKNYIEEQVPNCRATSYHGEMPSVHGKKLDEWGHTEWIQQVYNVDIMVIIPAIMCQILQKALLSLSMFDCIIFDECHNCFGNHPMKILCDYIKCSIHQPLLFGMTATPLKCKKGCIATKSKELEANMNCTMLCSEYYETVSNTDIVLVKYSTTTTTAAAAITNDPSNDYVDESSFLFSNSYVQYVNHLFHYMLNHRTKSQLCCYNNHLYILVHSYIRMRHANYMRIFVSLQSKMKLSHGKFHDTFGISLKGLRIVSTHHSHLENAQQSIGQLLMTASDNGSFCTIYAMKYFVGTLDTSNAMKSEQMTGNSYKASETGVVKVDYSRLKDMVKEIQSGPFSLSDLVDSETLLCSSLIEIFSILSTSIGYMLCAKASAIFDRRFTAMFTEDKDNSSAGIVIEYDMLSYILKVCSLSSSDVFPMRIDVGTNTFINRLSSSIAQQTAGGCSISTIDLFRLVKALQLGLDCMIESFASDISFQSLQDGGVTAAVETIDHFVSRYQPSLLAAALVADTVDTISSRYEQLKHTCSDRDHIDYYLNPLSSFYKTYGHEAVELLAANWITVKFKKISAKLISLIMFLKEFSISTKKPSGAAISDAIQSSMRGKIEFTKETACIVFCKLKLTAHSLCQLFEVINANSNALSITTGDGQYDSQVYRSTYLYGGLTHTIQAKTLLDFKDGIYNILFSTDISEEGIDICQCQYVINYEIPASFKSYIQRRGRARAANAYMISLIPANTTAGNTLINELLDFQQKEVDISVFNEAAVLSVAATTATTTTSSVEAQPIINRMDVSSTSTTLSTTYSSVTGSSSSIVGGKLVVTETQAEVHMHSASQLLIQHCQQLRRGKYSSSEPMFVMTSDNNNVQQFQCAVLLPPQLPVAVRCVIGPWSRSKKDAKGMLCLLCIQKLHQCGELDDRLKSSYIELLHAEQTYECHVDSKAAGVASSAAATASAAGSAATAAASSTTASKQTFGNDVIHSISKVVPDCMIPPALDGQPTALHMHLYAVEVISDEETRTCLDACYSCHHIHNAINRIGISLLRKLPDEILRTTHRVSIRNTDGVSIRYQYLGAHDIPIANVIQMQRFHKAIHAWENEGQQLPPYTAEPCDACKSIECTPDCTCKPKIPIPPFLRPSDTLPMQCEESCIPCDEWCASSNKAFYIIFPVPESVLPSSIGSSSTPTVCGKCDILSDYGSWLQVLKTSSDEAHKLVYNLRLLKRLNAAKRLGYFEPIPDLQHDGEDLAGMLVARGSYDLFIVLDEQQAVHVDTVRIDDILRDKKRKRTSISAKPDGDDSIDAIDCSGGEAEMLPSPIPTAPVQTVFPNGSYADKILTREPGWLDTLVQIRDKPDHSMLPTVCVSAKLTIIPLMTACGKFKHIQQPVSGSSRLTDQLKTKQKQLRYHNHASVQHLVRECCHPLGRSVWMLLGLTCPSIVWRLQSMLLALECRDKVVQCMMKEPTIEMNSINPATMFPDPLLMLEAISPRMAGSNIDSERLEMIGDSLLKLVTTVELFRLYPSSPEGFLTSKRSRVISNVNLYDLAVSKKVAQYLHGVCLSSGKQLLQVRPSGLSMHSIAGGYSIWNNDILINKIDKCGVSVCAKRMNKFVRDSIKKMCDYTGDRIDISTIDSSMTDSNFIDNALYDHEIDYKIQQELLNTYKYTHLTNTEYYENVVHIYSQRVKIAMREKTLADLMEAIFGAFFVSGGITAGVAAIAALGAWPRLERDIHDRVLIDTSNSSSSNSNSNTLSTSSELPSTIGTLRVSDLRITNVTTADACVFPDGYPEELKRLVLGLDLNALPGSIDVTNLKRKMPEPPVPVTPTTTTATTTTTTTATGSLQDVYSSAQVVRKAELDKKIKYIHDNFGYKFKQPSLLAEALTHSSVLHIPSNQRLEFLGDAVIDFSLVFIISSEYKYANQGDITISKSSFSNNKALGHLAYKVKLHEVLNIGSNQLIAEIAVIANNMSTNGKTTGDTDFLPTGVCNALADCIEAVFGAIYVDCEGSIETVIACVKKVGLYNLH